MKWVLDFGLALGSYFQQLIYIYTLVYIYIIDSCSQVAGFMAIPDKYSRRKSTMSSTSAGRTPLMGVPCAFQNHHLVCKKHVEK